MAVREIEPHPVVGRVFLAVDEVLQRSVHAEMQRQEPVALKLDEQMLAVPARSCDARPRKRAVQLACGNACENARVADNHIAYPPTAAGGVEMALIEFDIG